MPGFMGPGGPRHERSNGFGSRRVPPPPPPHHDHRRDHRPGIGHGVRFFGPVRFRFFGMPIYISSGRTIGFLVAFFAIFVMIISTFGFFSGYKNKKADIKEYRQSIELIKQDRDLSLDVIAKAKAGESGYYIGKGTFYNTFRDNIYNDTIFNKIYKIESNVYQIGFSMMNTYNLDLALKLSLDEEFYTFASYSYDDLNNKLNNGTYSKSSIGSPIKGIDLLEFDVACAVVNGDTVAINLDFDGNIDYHIEYYNNLISETKASMKTQKVGIAVLIVIMLIVVVVIVLSVVKVIRKSIEKDKIDRAKAEAEVLEAQAQAQEAQARASIAQEQLDRKKTYCDYCGAKIGENETKCPNCGSVIFEVKKD